MTTRIVAIENNHYLWPVGSRRPTSYAVVPAHLSRFLAQHPSARVANEAEALAAIDANQAGPGQRKLTVEELSACYRDGMAYERFHAKEGVELASFAVN